METTGAASGIDVAVVGVRRRPRPLVVVNSATRARLLAPPGVVLRGWQMSQPSIRCDRASVSPEVWRGMARVWERQRREAWASRVLAGLR